MNIPISFLCSIFSITGSLIYLFLREGFYRDYFSVSKVLGLSLLLLALPVFVREMLPTKAQSRWYSSYSFVLFVLLVLLSVLGYVIKEFELTFISFISFLGFPLFIWILFLTFKNLGILKTLGLTIFGMLFSTFIVAVIFSYHVKPIFFEDTFSWSFLWKVDTLYHMAVAQMFNTYGVFSTGLDGVAYLPYHYGSHILYIGLSNFLSITIPETYILTPAILTAPVFFIVFFHLVYELRKAFGIPEYVNYLVGFIFLMAFVGFFRNTFYQSSGSFPEYMGMLMGSPILFLSDSYTISVVVLLVMFTIILNFGEEKKESNSNQLSTRLFLWVGLPLVFFCAGFSKISTLYIGFSVIGYLFVRLKLYKKREFMFSFLLLFAGAVLIYFLARDEKYGDGGISLFYHFKEAKQNVFLFLLLQFIWVWALLIIFIVSKLSTWNLWIVEEKRVPVEVTLAILLASLVPAVLIKVKGGQLYYFTEIPSLIATALILAYLPLFKIKKIAWLEEAPLLKKGLIILTVFYLLNVFYKNIGVYENHMMRLNYSTRYNMLTGPQGLPVPEKFVPKGLSSFSDDALQAIRSPFTSKYFDSTRINPSRAFVFKLSELSKLSLEEKKQSVVYVNFDGLNFTLPIKCYEKPFLIPSFTGMASIKSGITKSCVSENPWFSGYGYEYYDLVEPAGFDLAELKVQAAKKGFTWLFYYDPKRNDFMKVKC